MTDTERSLAAENTELRARIAQLETTEKSLHDMVDQYAADAGQAKREAIELDRRNKALEAENQRMREHGQSMKQHLELFTLSVRDTVSDILERKEDAALDQRKLAAAEAEIEWLKADADLLKAALRWCAENFTVKNGLRSDFTPGVRWMNFVKYAFVDPPTNLAAVIAEAVEQQKTGEHS